MPDHTPQHGRRPQFHRGRRGSDRRGSERRAPQAHGADSGRESTARDSGVDVEQIMREIRSRIAQRHGIELSTQQIQELAARRLEAILEPRNIKPQLLEQLRKNAATPELPTAPIENYTFEDTTLYETHRGILRFFRKLLNPILKLFFNPQPLIQALNTQARLNKEAAAREAERERRQAEWNALHYELLQRMVVEASRLSIETQSLTSRIESLATRVDFNDRRVRSLETTAPQQPNRPAPQPRQVETLAVAASAPDGNTPTDATPATDGGATEGTRRRRRRRRGRRSGAAATDGASANSDAATELDETDIADAESDEDEVALAAGETSADTNGMRSVPAEGTAEADTPNLQATSIDWSPAPPAEADSIETAPVVDERREAVDHPVRVTPHEPSRPAPPPDEPVPAQPETTSGDVLPRPQEPTDR